MAREITITRKEERKGDDGHRVVSIRMKDELVDQLDQLAGQTNRSRNEIVNILLEASIHNVKIEEYCLSQN